MADNFPEPAKIEIEVDKARLIAVGPYHLIVCFALQVVSNESATAFFF
jgi:hypothetical protein